MRIQPRNLCDDCDNGIRDASVLGLYRCRALLRHIVAPEIPSHCLFYEGQRFPVDVVIITAVPVELFAVADSLHPGGRDAWQPLPTESDGLWKTCLYKSERNPNARARLALGKTPMMGLPAAASLTALAIQLFRPSHVVMLGITAGLQGKTRIGDIIVPREVWDYGAGKWEERDDSLFFQPRAQQQRIQEDVRQWAELVAENKELLQNIRKAWVNRQLNSDEEERHFSTPVVRFEPMVSGAAVVNADVYCATVMRQAAAAVMRPDPWAAAGRL